MERGGGLLLVFKLLLACSELGGSLVQSLAHQLKLLIALLTHLFELLIARGLDVPERLGLGLGLRVKG